MTSWHIWKFISWSWSRWVCVTELRVLFSCSYHVELRFMQEINFSLLWFVKVRRCLDVTLSLTHLLTHTHTRTDVAFFDGTTSGKLTSRLTNDIGMMLSPIQNTMSTLLYNIVVLFGGIVMCFYTSYKLSMLAFTTVCFAHFDQHHHHDHHQQ